MNQKPLVYHHEQCQHCKQVSHVISLSPVLVIVTDLEDGAPIFQPDRTIELMEGERTNGSPATRSEDSTEAYKHRRSTRSVSKNPSRGNISGALSKFKIAMCSNPTSMHHTFWDTFMIKSMNLGMVSQAPSGGGSRQTFSLAKLSSSNWGPFLSSTEALSQMSVLACFTP